jgi:hypothetical protein
MQFKKAIVFAWLCLAALPYAEAKTPVQTRPEARALAESVMKLVVADKISEAFGLLEPHWRLPENEIATVVQKTVAMRNTVADRFGPSVGYSFIKEESVGDLLVRYTFVEKRANTPLRWAFVFYQIDGKWWVNSANWDDNVSALFGQ